MPPVLAAETPAWAQPLVSSLSLFTERLEDLENRSTTSDPRGRSRPRIVSTRQEYRLDVIQEQLHSLQTANSLTARKALQARTSARVFAGDIEAEFYEPGEELNISKEAHFVLLLRKINGLIPTVPDNEDAKTFIEQSIGFYSFANDTSVQHAKLIKSRLGGLQQLTDLSVEARTALISEAKLAELMKRSSTPKNGLSRPPGGQHHNKNNRGSRRNLHQKLSQ